MSLAGVLPSFQYDSVFSHGHSRPPVIAQLVERGTVVVKQKLTSLGRWFDSGSREWHTFFPIHTTCALPCYFHIFLRLCSSQYYDYANRVQPARDSSVGRAEDCSGQEHLRSLGRWFDSGSRECHLFLPMGECLNSPYDITYPYSGIQRRPRDRYCNTRFDTSTLLLDHFSHLISYIYHSFI